jgi:formylglycine-generating enzyme
MGTAGKQAPRGMVLVPGGTFAMGATEGESDRLKTDELPAHEVKIDPFYIDICPVTQAEFESVMGFNPSLFAHGPSCPVDSVSRVVALEYCAKVGKRLPTEAEWEYAARAGSKGLLYWGTQNYQEYAFLVFNSGFRTKGVGVKAPNEFGLHDTIGNVWEWCSDWYDAAYYTASPKHNPKGPDHGTEGVLRGCSWYTAPEDARVTARRKENPVNPSQPSLIGFRCAL